MSAETVPCETCHTPAGAKRCDRCWRIEQNLAEYLRSANGQKFVLEVLHDSSALVNYDKELQRRIAEALVVRALKVEAISPFKDAANMRVMLWKEAAEAIVSEDLPLLPELCPHGNELKLDEDSPCGCRQVEA